MRNLGSLDLSDHFTTFVDEHMRDHDDGISTSPDLDARYEMPPTPLMNDNESANTAANNPTTTWRNKWIGTRYFQIRNYVRNLQLLPTHVPTKYNVSDLFTKPITALLEFDKHCRFCGLVDPECTTLLYCELRAPHTHAALSRSVTHDQQAMYA